MNIEQCHAVINRLRKHFPYWGRTLTAGDQVDLAEDWAAVLADVEPKLVSAALVTLLAEPREHPPGLGVVNDRARKLAERAEGTPEVSAGEAWQRVTRAIVSDGYGAMWDAGQKARLTPAEIQSGEAIGLHRIRNRKEEDAGTDFAQFRDIYAVMIGRATAERNMPPMVRSVLAEIAQAWDAKRLSAPKDGAQ